MKIQKTIKKIKNKIIVALGGYTDLKTTIVPQIRYQNCIPFKVQSNMTYDTRYIPNDDNYKEYLRQQISYKIADYLRDNNYIKFQECDSIELLSKQIIGTVYVADIFPA